MTRQSLHRWTPEEVSTLRRMWSTHAPAEIAEALFGADCDIESWERRVRWKARDLGLGSPAGKVKAIRECWSERDVDNAEDTPRIEALKLILRVGPRTLDQMVADLVYPLATLEEVILGHEWFVLLRDGAIGISRAGMGKFSHEEKTTR